MKLMVIGCVIIIGVYVLSLFRFRLVSQYRARVDARLESDEDAILNSTEGMVVVSFLQEYVNVRTFPVRLEDKLSIVYGLTGEDLREALDTISKRLNLGGVLICGQEGRRPRTVHELVKILADVRGSKE
jgi:hypothetical protein